MPGTEATEQKNARAHAVDEEYEKLERFLVDRRKIVILSSKNPPQGGFGIVLRGELHQSAHLPAWLASRWYGPPQPVAVKQIKVPVIRDMVRVKRAFTREMLVWSRLGEHPGIAKFLGFYADFERAEAWLLSPWEPNGNVSQFVREHKLEVPEKLSLIYDTINALTFLHQLDPPVCHGDIKAANVLVTAEYKARLCDFGLARLHEDSGFGKLETSTGMKGSIRWCSPEILKDATRGPTSDVYAWAWLVWEIMTGDLPYKETNADYAIMYKIFENSLPQVDGKSRLSDCLQVWELMTRCWDFQPGLRPTASMCKTIITYLPRCTPAPANAESQTRSAALLENLGNLESWKGNPRKSSDYLEQALRLYKDEGDAKGVASVLLKQAAAAYCVSDFVKLRAVATTAVEKCRALDDALGIAEASYYLGFAVQMMGERDRALPLLRESLEIRRKHGDDVGVVQCLERIGDVQRCNGLIKDALLTLDEAVGIASRSGDRLGRANALHMVGLTHTDTDAFVEAAAALEEAIKITRSAGWEVELGMNLLSMGCLKLRSKEHREAEEYLRESVSIARRVKDRWKLAMGLEMVGVCLLQQSKPNEAVPALEEACQLHSELSLQRNRKGVALTLVELKTRQGKWYSALKWYDHLISACLSEKQELEAARHLRRKGDILVKLQRYDEAALYFEASMLIRKENGSLWTWQWMQLRRQLCAIPKTTMKWERRSPLLCDLKQLQRRQPQLVTASLRLPVLTGHVEL